MSGLGRALKRLLNTGIRLKYVFALLVLFVGGAAALTYSKTMTRVGGKSDYAEAMRYVELKKLVDEKYIDPVDDSAMTDSASMAIVSGLNDKWSYYMNADEYQAYQLYSSNEYSNIGMSIMKGEKGGFDVVSVNPGTPAAFSGLQAGMTIESVDGNDVTDADIDDVRLMIRSKMNTSFKLGIKGESNLTVDCTGSYSSPVNYRLEKTNAGYIQIKNFEAGSGADTIAAIEDLVYNMKAVALCIDVRGNPGGLANEMTQVLDYLIPSGVLFYQTDKSGNMIETRSDIMSLELPMVILFDTNTFAEAELFAAVMKEEYSPTSLYTMGEATTGMTRTQETFELGDGSAVRLSTKSYLTASGVDISLAGGVIPDLIVHNEDPSTVGTTQGTLTENNGTTTMAEDTQLLEALKYLS